MVEYRDYDRHDICQVSATADRSWEELSLAFVYVGLTQHLSSLQPRALAYFVLLALISKDEQSSDRPLPQHNPH